MKINSTNKLYLLNTGKYVLNKVSGTNKMSKISSMVAFVYLIGSNFLVSIFPFNDTATFVAIYYNVAPFFDNGTLGMYAHEELGFRMASHLHVI